MLKQGQCWQGKNREETKWPGRSHCLAQESSLVGARKTIILKCWTVCVFGKKRIKSKLEKEEIEGLLKETGL